jgi:hypothetical protein
VPGPGIHIGGWIGIRAVGEATIAVIKIAAGITEEILILEAIPDIPIIGKAVAENDDLAESRRALREQGRHEKKKRQGNGRDARAAKRWVHTLVIGMDLKADLPAIERQSPNEKKSPRNLRYTRRNRTEPDSLTEIGAHRACCYFFLPSPGR